MAALPTGTSSIQIPVLCLLVNGDPSTLEVCGGWGEKHLAGALKDVVVLQGTYRVVWSIYLGATFSSSPEDFQGSGAGFPMADPGRFWGHC